jgi:hypothetical protein
MRSILLLGVLLFIGCDGAIESQYTPQIVIQGFIYPGEGIDSVILHYTTEYTQVFSDSASAIEDAIVTVNVDGTDHTLQKIPGLFGRYYLPKSELTVQGGKTYVLTVKAGGVTATASTIVPMPISITNRTTAFPAGNVLLLDTTNATNFAFTLTAGPVDNPSRLYMLKVSSLDTTIGRIHTGIQGPPVDTLAYTRYGFIQTAPNMQLYSRLFGWFGANRISILALDTNWVDYKRAVGYGSEAFLPYQSSLNHIIGGIGCWGSAGKDTVTVYVKLKQ